MNFEIVGQLATRSSGFLVLPRVGFKVGLGSFLRVENLPTGNFVIEPLPEWVPISRACEVLGVSDATVRRYFDAGPGGGPILKHRQLPHARIQVELKGVMALAGLGE